LNWLFRPHLARLVVTSYVAGPLGLLLIAWAWVRLRNTAYRDMTVLLLAVVAVYAAVLAASISFDERYAGILVLLVLLVALDQWRASARKGLTILVVGTFAFGGLASFAAGARVLIHGHYYDPVSGTSQQIVPPAILEYLRSAATEHHWQNPIAVLPSPVAAVALPGFRFIVIHPDFIGGKKAGRADRIFVVVQETMIQDGRAGAVLKSFVNYDVNGWDQTHVEGMVIYSQ
jgi:hypothetical protein